MNSLNMFEKGILTEMLMELRKALKSKVNFEHIEIGDIDEYEIKIEIVEKAIRELLPKKEDCI